MGIVGFVFADFQDAYGGCKLVLDLPKVSSFTGLSCHQKGYGFEKVVESWYSTAYLQRLLSRQKLLVL